MELSRQRDARVEAQLPQRPIAQRSQQGAVAVEFAFIFPILFLLMYGIVVYSYVFVLNSALNYAVQESVASALRVAPAEANSVRQIEALNRARAALQWLPQAQRDRVFANEALIVTFDQSCSAAAAISDCIRVRLTMPIQNPALFPRLTLPLVGTIPPLPQSLSAEAVARI
jgi:hypothetical protein